MAEHFVTIRLEYVYHAEGRTPWKRRGVCTCGWQCLSWNGLRPILIAADHVAVARQFAALINCVGRRRRKGSWSALALHPSRAASVEPTERRIIGAR